MLVIPDVAEPYSPLPESVVVPVHSSRSMVSCLGSQLCGVHAVAVKHFSHTLAPEAGTAVSWVCQCACCAQLSFRLWAALFHG